MVTVLGIRSAGALALMLCGATSGQDAPRAPLAIPTRLPPLSPAVIDDALAIGGREIAARKVSTRMSVAVRINGDGPYRFVVDSGADTSAISSAVAQALRLPAGRPATLHGITATARVERVRVDELALGDSVIRDLELPALREDDLGAAGLVGIDALVEQRLMMDFDRRLITIEDARRPQRRYDGEVVVVARRRRGQLILTEASVVGRHVDAVIDTGSEVTIGNGAMRALLARRIGTRMQTVEVTGVTGVTIPIQLARLPELRVGPILLRDVPVAFADIPPFTAFALDKQPALLLGTDLMSNFRRVSLDFRARKVRFQLRRCAATSVIISTTGSASRLSATTPGGSC